MPFGAHDFMGNDSTIDHVVMVRDEILCTPLYLGDNLP